MLSQRETMWIGEEHISSETKPHGPSLCCSRFQGRLHGCNFLATHSLLLKPEITGKVPKGFRAWTPPESRERSNPLRVGSEQKPSGSALSGVWQTPSTEPSWSQAAPCAQSTHLLSCVFLSLTRKAPRCPSLCGYMSKDFTKWPSAIKHCLSL